MVSALGSFIGLIAINQVQPIAQTQTTIQTPTGTSTVYTKSCTSVPDISGNSLCLGSNNVQNPTTTTTPAALSPVCSSSGTTCTSVPVATIPKTNTTTIPVVSTVPVVQIIPIVTITDNFGKVTSPVISGVNFGLSALSSFIAVHGTNTPIDHGTISIQLSLKSIPGDNLTTSGIFWVSINGTQLHPQGIPFAVSGITDSSGNLPINLQLPTGFTKTYVLTVNDRASMLVSPVNILNFTISNVSIKNAKGQSYLDTKQTLLYSVQLDSDPNKVIQAVGSTGQYVQVLPSDDTFSIVSASRSYTQYVPCLNPKCGGGTYQYVTTQPPSIGSAYVYQENCSAGTECLIASVAGFSSGTAGSGNGGPNGCNIYCSVATGGGTQSIGTIPRDVDIRIQVNSPNSFSKTLHTDLANHQYQWYCNDQGCTFS